MTNRVTADEHAEMMAILGIAWRKVEVATVLLEYESKAGLKANPTLIAEYSVRAHYYSGVAQTLEWLMGSGRSDRITNLLQIRADITTKEWCE